MKTAVEWLYNKMFENQGRILREDYEQAKEMEKQQIIDAYDNGKYITSGKEFGGEQYYNATFKSK
jgi:hypothetical protein